MAARSLSFADRSHAACAPRSRFRASAFPRSAGNSQDLERERQETPQLAGDIKGSLRLGLFADGSGMRYESRHDELHAPGSWRRECSLRLRERLERVERI